MSDEAVHAQRPRPQGWMDCKKCGAKTRSGKPCLSPAIQGKQRCRMHGGRSTGARTPAGRQRVIAANLRHGRRSKRFQQALREGGVVADAIEAEMIAQEFKLHEAKKAAKGTSTPSAGAAPPPPPSTAG